MDGNLTGLCFENKAADAHNVADVQLFEALVFLLTQGIAAHIALQSAAQILHMAERGFSHNALGHNASRNGDFFIFQCVKIVFNILGGVGSVVLGYLKGILSCRLQFGKLFTATIKT